MWPAIMVQRLVPHLPDDFTADDYRKNHPRFAGENLDRNQSITRVIEEIAAEKQCKASQLALAWLLARGKDVVPIPGTKRQKYVEENAAAADIKLTPDEVARLDAELPPGIAAGPRYPEPAMKRVNL